MLNQTEKYFLQLCEESSCIIILTLDLDSQDTVLCLDMDINIERFENGYWGREYSDGYECKAYRF